MNPVSLVLMTAVLAQAQVHIPPVDGPATENPSSGNCGFPATLTNDQLKQEIRKVWNTVLELARIRPPGGHPWARMVIMQDVTPTVPADFPNAFAAEPFNEKWEIKREDYVNPTSYPTVFVSLGICTAAHSKDELAFVFAHEYTHLENRDGEAMHAQTKKLWGPWMAKQDAPPSWSFLPGLAQQKFMRDNFWALASFERPLEDRADRGAVEILRQRYSPYDPAKGADLMAHFKDSMWALGFDTYPFATTHSTERQRVENINAWSSGATPFDRDEFEQRIQQAFR